MSSNIVVYAEARVSSDVLHRTVIKDFSRYEDAMDLVYRYRKHFTSLLQSNQIEGVEYIPCGALAIIQGNDFSQDKRRVELRVVMSDTPNPNYIGTILKIMHCLELPNE